MKVLVYITSASLECYSVSKNVIIKAELTIDRSSCSEVLYKKDVHRKTSVPESLFNKVADLQFATLLKRGSSTGDFL